MNRRKFIAGTMLAAAGSAATAHAGGRIFGNGVMPNAVADEPAKTGMHKFSKLRTITLEEHYTGPAFIASGAHAPGPTSENPRFQATMTKLQDLGAGRLALMDEAGIDVQILSHRSEEH